MEMKIQKTPVIKRDEVTKYLAEHEPFRNGTAYGLYAEEDDNIYCVVSYLTVIARIDTRTNKVLTFGSNYYSRTTSFIQNAVRKVYDTAAFETKF